MSDTKTTTKKKIIVTGGAGFIGSHLVDKLCEDSNNEVIVFDNYSSYGKEHCAQYANPKAKYVEVDICYAVGELLDARMALADADVIYHLAAEARIQASFDNPQLSLNTNVIGTMSLLTAAYEANKTHFRMPKIIFTSTSSLHKEFDGKNKIPAGAKIDDNINPKTPYGIGKHAAEKLIEQYWGNQCGGDWVIARLFNVYGPRQPITGKYATVVGLFEKQLLEGKPMTIVGDGKQVRDFTYVEDVVAALIALFNSPNKTSKIVHNLASGGFVDMFELAQLLIKHHGINEYGFKHLPERRGESRSVRADNYSNIRWIRTVLNPKNIDK
jgi:UDP-glucose 4-epimerase